MSRRQDLRDEFERILRGRTYDRHAEDEEIFEELLDDLADVAMTEVEK